MARKTSRPAPPNDTERALRAWLGRDGVPPPLDLWLSRHARRDRSQRQLFGPLTAACAWSITALCALDREPVAAAHALATEGVLGALRRADHKELFTAIRGLTGGAMPRGVERRLGRGLGALEADDSWVSRCARWGVPPSFAAALEARAATGFDARSWLELQHVRPPLWVRARGDIDEVAGLLVDDGYAVEVHGSALRLDGGRDIRAARAYVEGRIEVQDLGSQLAGAALAVEPGQQIWDVCAGRGGKTMQLADALAGRGAVHASDVDADKLSVLKKRARRAGLSDHVRVHPWDGTSALALGREVSKRGGVHGALVDAPCSAAGTWRRNPDARLRVDAHGIPELAALQLDLLQRAVDALRPGGRVAYVTCSWVPAEDEAVVEALLAERPGLTLRSAELVGAPAHDADTLYVAVLSR